MTDWGESWARAPIVDGVDLVDLVDRVDGACCGIALTRGAFLYSSYSPTPQGLRRGRP